MALAVGAAINRFYGLGLSVREIAQLSDRGARSGIGIGIFEKGGVIVDGGRGPNTATPPVIAQMAVPERGASFWYSTSAARVYMANKKSVRSANCRRFRRRKPNACVICC